MGNFLKKKICDRKFLRLIKKRFRTRNYLKKSKKVGMLGVPQGGIASSILFNIYMHEFDQMVEEKVGELLKKNNKEEGRVPMEKASTKKYKKLKSRIDSNRARIKRLIKKHQGLNEDNIDKYKELVLEKRQAKKKRLQVPFINRRKILLTFSYTRYADDWIILTNASEKHCEKIKKLLTDI